MEPHLILQLTPPSNRSQKIVDYLARPSTRKAFKRKANYGFTTPSPKRLCVDHFGGPESSTIDDVLARTRSSHLQLSIAFQSELTQSKTLAERLEEIESRVDELEAHKTQLDTWIQAEQRERLPFFIANMIYKHISRIWEVNRDNESPAKPSKPSAKSPKPSVEPLSSKKSTPPKTQVHSAQSITEDMLNYCDKAGLKPEHHKVHLRLVEFWTASNIVAHETKYAFAWLLCSEQFRGGPEYEAWAGLFPFVYGCTVEEAAAEDKRLA